MITVCQTSGQLEPLDNWDRTLCHRLSLVSIDTAEKRGKQKRESICHERTREGRRQSDEHRNTFRGSIGETSQRRVGAHQIIWAFPSAYISS